MLRHRTVGRLGWIAGALLAAGASVAGADDAPIGFAPASRAPHGRHEAHALAVPTPDAARAWLHSLTEDPHVAGTPADRKTADFLADKLRSWGWQVDIEEFEVLLNYPKPASVRCELVRPTATPLKVVEDPVVGDKDSASPDVLPAFHGYGASGDVTGQVVYANYGRPDDFSALSRLGVDVRGKIVLVRYGELFRGLKIRNAQRLGAKGVLIYSDPADDGYAKGDTYPAGPFRPESAIQRGSVQFLSLGPGDPSTPDAPSIRGARRLPWDPRHGFTLTPDVDGTGGTAIPGIKAWERESGQARDSYFATIPSLPISYEAARPILAALGGSNVPTGWQGGLPLAYHVGPGPAEVHFAIEMEYQVRPIWNVVARLVGQVEPDRWVMIGNHRDAWVYGAVDPGSGTAATLEMCRALGSAVAQGWKPRRTLVYASWDAEEYGLVGSTEWSEQHEKEVDERAVMMLNVDSAVSGTDLDLDGVPSLRDLVLEAAGEIRDVRSNRTIRDDWMAKRRGAWAGGPVDLDDLWAAAPGAGAAAAPVRKFSPRMNPLGSGSDYTAFVDHLGVPAVDIGFTGRYGVYHSVYDNYSWMERFGDPEFLTHAMAARLYTVIAMRAASAEVIPFRFVPYAESLREHVDDLRRILVRTARAGEADASRPPLAFEGLPRLVAAIRGFEAQAAATDAATAALAGRDNVPAPQLGKVNDALVKVERSFLLPKGLPGRPWFRHAIYAPGLTTGYASWPLPGVRQGIEDRNAEMLGAQTAALAERIEAATAALKAVAAAVTEPPTVPAPPPPGTAPAAPPAGTAPVPAPTPTTAAPPQPGRGGR